MDTDTAKPTPAAGGLPRAALTGLLPEELVAAELIYLLQVAPVVVQAALDKV